MNHLVRKMATISSLKLDLESASAIKLQNWWRTNTRIKKLKKVHAYLSSCLSIHDLQELSNKCTALSQACIGDGAGLAGGTMIDMLLCSFLKEKLTEYSDYHNGESDMKLCDVSLSLKKINGKSTVALDWSKNEKKSEREHFSSDMMIINLKSEQWWKKTPIKPSNDKIIYNDMIPSGIYIVDKQYCKYYVKLSSNNKTNTLITDQYLYIMLKRSISQNLFIPLPAPNKPLKFNILHAFSE